MSRVRRSVDQARRLPMSKSEQMARVRSRDTDAEILLRRALWRAGMRYRTTAKKLPGTPDVTFGRLRTAVFVDGCFWHGCPAHYTEPKTNRAFWQEKLRRNQERDRKVDALLTDMGWLVLRLWEHEVYENLPAVVKWIRRSLGVRIEPRWTNFA
jgi:DNA mismatch endonuclease (patch repair protein)